MTDQEKNIAMMLWQGLTPHVTTFREYKLEIEGSTGNFVEKKCSCGRVTRLGKKHTEEDSRPLCTNTDYLNTNAAFDLLDELVKRGYSIQLIHTVRGYEFATYPPFDASSNGGPYVGVNESKSRAIVEAILLMIEKEKEK